ncbi:unnamed protein product [Enterobius vermicularis]|uniref:C-type lectin domain-containing protein n=1 Tax=Enterobius vermicularis TaxID=51028 RepID=A0A0N4V2U2_ENTVE|nr:unnamed protein product [Enterobius vermicularis]
MSVIRVEIDGRSQKPGGFSKKLNVRWFISRHLRLKDSEMRLLVVQFNALLLIPSMSIDYEIIGECQNLRILTNFKILTRLIYTGEDEDDFYCLLNVETYKEMTVEEMEDVCSKYYEGHALSIANEEEFKLFDRVLLKDQHLEKEQYIWIPLGINHKMDYFYDFTDSAFIVSKKQRLPYVTWKGGDCYAFVRVGTEPDDEGECPRYPLQLYIVPPRLVSVNHGSFKYCLFLLSADNILENPNKYDPISQGYAVDFDTAAQYCLRKFNGHLLSIQDAEELMFISNSLYHCVDEGCVAKLELLLGLQSRGKTAAAFFADGTKTEYVLSRVEIFHNTTERLCFFLSSFYRFSIVTIVAKKCGWYYYFVCKAPVKYELEHKKLPRYNVLDVRIDDHYCFLKQ